jgi:6-phosphogluconate dehydrogenase
MATADIGVYGLSVMGQNLALNLAEKGFQVRARKGGREGGREGGCRPLC